MARLKFLVFALLVLVVWAVQLILLTPPLVKESMALAMAQAQASRPLAQAHIGERRQLLMRAVTKLSAQAMLASVVQALHGTGKEAVTPEKLQPLRGLATQQADQAIKDGLVVGYTWDAGGIFFRGEEPAEELDPALGKAGQDGMLQEAFGVGHLFVSLPVWDRSGAEPKMVGAVVLGTPLLSAGMMDAVSKDSALAAAGIFQGGRLVQGGGADKAALERAAKAAQLGKATVVEQGKTGSLGPLKLPLFTVPSDWMGGRAPLLIASRQAIEDTPYEFIALASVKPLMTALGAYQRFVLLVLGGLFLLTLVWAVLMGSGEAAAVAEADQEQARATTEAVPKVPAPQMAATMPDPGRSDEPEDPRLAATVAQMVQPIREPVPEEYREPDQDLYQDPEQEPYREPEQEPYREPEQEPYREPQPEEYQEPDYQGEAAPPEPPPEPTTAAEANLLPPSSTPFEVPSSSDPFAQYQAPPEMSPEGTGGEEAPYGSPGQEPAPDPTSAQPMLPDYGSQEDGDSQDHLPRFSSDPSVPVEPEDNPDATRVAVVPQELLAASARATTPAMVAAPRQSGSLVLPRMPTVPAAQANPEDLHFQEVYRDFVATRERCGEAADGLTADKFVQKLRKNKEQLVQKYGCRTVRFTVYVKEGKAALKATPVKD